jgi:hypothetical protein
MIGIMHHCLTNRQSYDENENTAFPAPQTHDTDTIAAAA